jgi:6-pyruvoyltetrahydropterin/6-carboxytetrahydropterin synthase
LFDFKRIKTVTGKVIDELDHKFLNDMEVFKEVNPSSENIARYIFRALADALNSEKVRVSRVTAWESDTACASYTEP